MVDAELEPQPLVCECETVADEGAPGWRALLAGGVVEGVDVGELEVATYCPDCAEAEFGGA